MSLLRKNKLRLLIEDSSVPVDDERRNLIGVDIGRKLKLPSPDKFEESVRAFVAESPLTQGVIADKYSTVIARLVSGNEPNAITHTAMKLVEQDERLLFEPLNNK